MARLCEGCVNAPHDGMDDIAATKMTPIDNESAVSAVQLADAAGVRSHPFLLSGEGNQEQKTERLMQNIDSCPGVYRPTLEESYRGSVAACQAADVHPYKGMVPGDCIKTLVTLSHTEFTAVPQNLEEPERV